MATEATEETVTISAPNIQRVEFQIVGNADEAINNFLGDVAIEVARARQKHPPMHSLHEAFAVILEEVDEFKLEVWKKQTERNPGDVYTELVHIAAMALRCVVDCGPKRFQV